MFLAFINGIFIGFLIGIILVVVCLIDEGFDFAIIKPTEANKHD